MNYKKYRELLKARQENGNFRKLSFIEKRKNTNISISSNRFIDFASNDYLSLSCDERIKNAAIAALNEFGCSSGASRLMSGNNILFEKLENDIAEFKNAKASLVLGSGYQANVGIIPALVGRHDLIVADELIHASLIDGAILSRAKMIRYKHNDLTNLEDILEKSKNKYSDIFIVTESLFSMDGDIAPLNRIVDLKEKYNALSKN